MGRSGVFHRRALTVYMWVLFCLEGWQDKRGDGMALFSTGSCDQRRFVANGGTWILGGMHYRPFLRDPGSALFEREGGVWSLLAESALFEREGGVWIQDQPISLVWAGRWGLELFRRMRYQHECDARQSYQSELDNQEQSYFDIPYFWWDTELIMIFGWIRNQSLSIVSDGVGITHSILLKSKWSWPVLIAMDLRKNFLYSKLGCSSSLFSVFFTF